MNPMVSVCISTFNRLDQLKVAIQSIYNQDYPNIEISIYDNASTDGTTDYIHALDVGGNVIGLLRTFTDTRNPNAMETLNKTFHAARGEYILVMDDDAYLSTPDVISKLVETMDKNKDAAIVGANVKSPASVDGHLWQMPIRTEDGLFIPDWQIDRMGTFVYFEFHGACALFRKEFVRQSKFYDETFTIYMNELDLACKMLSRYHDVLIRSDAVAIHTGVGDRNACNKRVYYFIRNYNTILTRNFRTVTGRLKAVLAHTFMSSGYYAERILIHKTCKTRLTIFSFGLYMLKATGIGLYRCFFPDQKNEFNGYVKQSDFEQAMYNGFKRCIKDRLFWFLARKDTTVKGVR
jgi:glycosyltransferase involved in cell wall biosynthesis